MDIDKELEALMNDPLLNMTEQERALFDIPEDMKKLSKRERRRTTWHNGNLVRIFIFTSLFLKKHIRN